MPSELPIHQPNLALIGWLEGQLERAKTGELVGIASVLQFNDGYVGDAWSLSPHHEERLRIAGCLFSLMNELTLYNTDVAARLRSGEI